MIAEEPVAHLEMCVAVLDPRQILQHLDDVRHVHVVGAQDIDAVLPGGFGLRGDAVRHRAVGQHADLAGYFQPARVGRDLDRMNIVAERREHAVRIHRFEHLMFPLF